MTLLEQAESYIVGHVVFPATNYLFNRRNIMDRYYELERSERWDEEQLHDLQLSKIKQLVAYAYQRVPFYAERFRAIGLQPGDIASLKDFKRIPPLSRQDLIDHRARILDENLGEALVFADKSGRAPGEPIPFAPFRRHRLVRNTSSGSTGAPTIFYEDGSRTALNWVHELRLKSWFGVPPGAREARMVRLSTQYLPKSAMLRLRNRLWNQLILPGVNLSDHDYGASVGKIIAFRPRTLWGFTSALAGLAEYVLRNNIDASAWGIKLVIGWAAPVYDHERKRIQEAFSCPVSNIYGAREVGHIAGQCAEGAYHINEEHLLVEDEESSGTGGEGDLGEVVATTLDISPMPFLRYRMGDVGRVARSTCSCGRKLRVLRDFLGRTGEIYRTRDGRMISPNFWCRTFMDVQLSNAVNRFQIVYVNDSVIKIRIVKNAEYTEKTEHALKQHLKNNFPGGMIFKFQYVPEIKPQISGKYQMVVNEMAGGQSA